MAKRKLKRKNKKKLKRHKKTSKDKDKNKSNKTLSFTFLKSTDKKREFLVYPERKKNSKFSILKRDKK